MNHFDQVAKLAQDLQPELVALSTSIHDHPEMGHQETFAADAHCALLEKYGFTVERPFCGLPTAFKATYSSQNPAPPSAFWPSMTPCPASATAVATTSWGPPALVPASSCGR